MPSEDLASTWILMRCGSKKFAINTKFILGTDNFEQASCLKAKTLTGINRGTFSVLGIDMIVLDGHRIIAEESVINQKLKKIDEINKLKEELNTWVDEIEWGVLIDKKVNTDCKTLDIWKWLDSSSELDTLETRKLKDKVKISLQEIELLAKDAIKNKKNAEKGTKYSINLVEEIRYSIDKNINKQLNRLVTIYNKEVKEVCLIITYDNRKYGLVVDKIDYIKEQTELIIAPKFSEYKVIAGTCKYDDVTYDIINIKYITSLAKKYEN